MAAELGAAEKNRLLEMQTVNKDYVRVREDVRQTAEYANFLVSTRTLHEEPDPDSAALQL